VIAFDTDPAAHKIQIQVYRRLGPEARLRRALEMCDDLRLVARSGIRARHPAYSDDEVNLALFRLLLGDALYQAAYRGQPLLDP
jgi:hypothetical protein